MRRLGITRPWPSRALLGHAASGPAAADQVLPSHGRTRCPLRGSFEGDIDVGLDLDVDMDIERYRYMAVPNKDSGLL